jgi:hypothetical protein
MKNFNKNICIVVFVVIIIILFFVVLKKNNYRDKFQYEAQNSPECNCNINTIVQTTQNGTEYMSLYKLILFRDVLNLPTYQDNQRSSPSQSQYFQMVEQFAQCLNADISVEILEQLSPQCDLTANTIAELTKLIKSPNVTFYRDFAALASQLSGEYPNFNKGSVEHPHLFMIQAERYLKARNQKIVPLEYINASFDNDVAIVIALYEYFSGRSRPSGGQQSLFSASGILQYIIDSVL